VILRRAGHSEIFQQHSRRITRRAGRREGFLLGERSRETRDARMRDTSRCRRWRAARGRGREAVIHSTFCNLPFLSALIYVE